MKTLIGRTLTALAVIAMAVPAQVVAAEPVTPQNRIHDVRLTNAGGFAGSVVTDKGKPVAGIPVLVLSDSKPVAKVKTDKNGRYRVEGLRPGMHQVQTVNGRMTCRFWSPDTAPPSAKSTLVLPTSTTVVRGQDVITLGPEEIVITPGGLMTVAAFSAVSFVTVSSATDDRNADNGGGTTPPPASP